MRSIGFCYSEQAVNVSNPIVPDHCRAPDPDPPSARPDATTSSYRVDLSSGKRIVIKLTWRRGTKQGPSIDISEHPDSAGNPIVLRKPRGTEYSEVSGKKVEVCWDFSRAEYGSGPEPVAGFYLAVLIDSEMGLGLGDIAVEKRVLNGRLLEFKLISRCDVFAAAAGGSSFVTSRAKFSDEGKFHDISIGMFGTRNSNLSVYVDGKSVAEVRGLRWNFRGNQPVFVDGLLVDLMWDLHDWFFGPPEAAAGRGVFLFRTRSGLGSRLYVGKDGEDNVFSLIMICACE